MANDLDSSAAINWSRPLGRHPVNELAAAYVEAWGKIDNVVKNASNPHFGSNYADLGAVLDTVRPIFAGCGLALVTAPGEMDGDKMTLTWTLLHKSGQLLEGKMSLPIGAKATAQAGGSCLTYMRRYLTASIGGIAQVDDDGNAASAPPKESKKAAKPANYADLAEGYLKEIEECETVEALDALKPKLAELGDQRVADAFGARKKLLRGKK